MILLGIDPGTAITGYAILEVDQTKKVPKILDVSSVNTPSSMDMHHRLLSLHDNLNDVIVEYSPSKMIVERLFFNTNVKTALSVGQARGVPLLLAARHNIEVYEYTALQAKKSVFGYGRASKKEMQEAVRDFFSLEDIIKPDDANDAVAMALCYLDLDCADYKFSLIKAQDGS